MCSWLQPFQRQVLYSLTGADDADTYFTIDSTTGVVRLARPLVNPRSSYFVSIIWNDT